MPDEDYNRLLNEQGVKEAEEVLLGIADKAKKLVANEFHDYYVNLPDYIESDSWLNFRNKVESEVEGSAWEYAGTQGFGERIRAKIFEEHKDELIPLLNADLLKKISDLESRIESLQSNWR